MFSEKTELLTYLCTCMLYSSLKNMWYLLIRNMADDVPYQNV